MATTSISTVEYYKVKQRVKDVDGKRQYEERVNWRLRAENGQIVCSSQQGFRDEQDAQRSVGSVQKTFVTGAIRFKK